MAKVDTIFGEGAYEDEAPLTQEEAQTLLHFNEHDILKELTSKSLADHRTEIIEVLLGRTKFSFRIRALSEKEWDRCRERNTKYVKNRKLGNMRFADTTDLAMYHSDLIYTATVDEDKAKIWDNKNLWKPVNAVTGVDMIEKLIPYAGKKQDIVGRIERLSGFDEDAEIEFEEAIKNS